MADYRIIPCEENARHFVRVYAAGERELFCAVSFEAAKRIMIEDHDALAAYCWADPSKVSQPIIELDANIPAPFHLPLNEFAQGHADLEIDDIFGKPLSTLLADYDLRTRVDIGPSSQIPTVRIGRSASGIIFADAAGSIIGAYLGCDLSLAPEWRGKGLGAELVLERCLEDGVNPAAQLDTAAYTPAGYASHVSAWNKVRSDPLKTRLRAHRRDQHFDSSLAA